MRTVTAGPVELRLPEALEQREVREERQPAGGRRYFFESRETVRAHPAALLVTVLDDGGDLEERLARHRHDIARLSVIEDLRTARTSWPGLGEAHELRYVDRPHLAGGLPLRAYDRLVVDARGRYVVVALKAPDALWDRFALEGTVDSLAAVS